MNWKCGLVLIAVIALGVQPVFAQYELPEPGFSEGAETRPQSPAFRGDLRAESSGPFRMPVSDDAVYYLWDFSPLTLPEPAVLLPAAAVAAAASTDAGPEIPQNIRNNQHYLESLRQAQLAQDAYENGDYDASTAYAEEAIRYARLSDEYVALQLKIKETNDAITSAKQRLDWAVSSGAAKQRPSEYGEAEIYYNTSLTARSDEEWDAAIDAANQVIAILAYIQAPDGSALPAYYTVRTWAVSRDCLWNIAGRPWAYNDPTKWRIIYNANKAKMPDPDNPDLIHPGMTLDIPSITGEERQGAWVEGKSYSSR
jgi:nucleoid-associated protein YgaU